MNKQELIDFEKEQRRFYGFKCLMCGVFYKDGVHPPSWIWWQGSIPYDCQETGKRLVREVAADNREETPWVTAVYI